MGELLTFDFRADGLDLQVRAESVHRARELVRQTLASSSVDWGSFALAAPDALARVTARGGEGG